MKILQINKFYYPKIGGIETVVKNIYDWVNNDFINIDILACNDTYKREIIKDKNNYIYKSKTINILFGMPISIDLFKIFFKIKNNYDLFLIHYPFPLSAILSFFIPKNKLIIYYHCDIVRQKFLNFILSPLINRSLKKSKNIIVSSKNILENSSVIKKYKEKCIVIPFVIDYKSNGEDEENASKIKEKYKDNKLLLSVGRLVYYKGFDYLIKAIPLIEANLLIIGAGPKEKELGELIVKLKLENKVSIIPPKKNLKPYFMAADLFVFPSIEKSEAFGIVQLESMASGTPIVNTYLETGVEEVSINEKTGLTVNPKNSEELANAINKIISNEDLIYKYGKNAKKRYSEFFTKEKFIENFQKFLLKNK